MQAITYRMDKTNKVLLTQGLYIQHPETNFIIDKHIIKKYIYNQIIFLYTRN